jgi:hypothetical protein
MASDVEICNRALQKLGVARIVSLTEESTAARACNAAYTAVRDAELEDHTWSFAIQRSQLAASSTAPLFGKTNYFPLPTDFIRLAEPDEGDNLNSLDWQIEYEGIATDDGAPLEIRYVSKVTDPNKMTPLFREAFAARLAVELCEELTQSNTKMEAVKQWYKEQIGKAKKSNAIQRPAQQPPTDTWLTCRQ